MRIEEIEYHADGARLVGTLAVDTLRQGQRPGVLVCHEGGGLADHTRKIAERLAGLGYVAFAMDYYGDGKPVADFSIAMERISGWIADPTGIRARATAALEVLKAQPETDAGRLASIGYCFGGTTSLELARAGTDLKVVVGFHSGLATSRPAQPGAVKARVLVEIGAADPIIPADQRLAFETEMTAAGVDWRMTLHGGAGHSFTNPAVNALNRPGFAYDAAADARSWATMIAAFDEAFA